MAYEIDQDEENTAPQGSVPSGPAASAPSAPSAPSAAPANSGSRFVAFDQLAAMNAPSAQQTASTLVQGVDQAFGAAKSGLEGAVQTFDKDTVKGISAGGYAGPTDFSSYAADARKTFGDARQQAQALQAGPAGIQTLLQKGGQSSDAARYNSLFANQFVQPQVAQNKYAAFDSLLTDANKKAGQSQSFAEGQSRVAQYEENRIAGNRRAWADQQAKDAATKAAQDAQIKAEQDAYAEYVRKHRASNPLNPSPPSPWDFRKP